MDELSASTNTAFSSILGSPLGDPSPPAAAAPPCSLLDLGRDVLLAQGLSNTALPDPDADGAAAPETDASTAAAVVPRIECLPGKLPDFAPFAAVTALGANFLADGSGPATVDLRSLRCLAAVEPGFCRGSGVASVRLPGSVTAIGAGFCAGTGRLGRLDLRGDCPLLESIDDTFCSCSALTALTLPPALRHVGDSFCSSLQCADFPPPEMPSLMYAGTHFFYCVNFRPRAALDLSGTNLKELRDSFLRSVRLDKVLLPERSIFSVNDLAFEGTRGLKSVSLSMANPPGGRAPTVGHGFAANSEVEEIHLANVTAVKNHFAADSKLRQLRAAGLTSVGSRFLMDCGGVEEAGDPTTVEDIAFTALEAIGPSFLAGVTATKPLNLSLSRLLDLPDNFLERASVPSVSLPPTVVRIGSGCMAHMTGVALVEQPTARPQPTSLGPSDEDDDDATGSCVEVLHTSASAGEEKPLVVRLHTVRHIQDDFLRGADRPVRLRASSALQSVGDAFCAFPLESEAVGGGGSGGGGGGYGALSLPGSASVGANFAHSARLRQSRVFRPVARAFFASQRGPSWGSAPASDFSTFARQGSAGRRSSVDTAAPTPDAVSITIGENFMAGVEGVTELDMTDSLVARVGARFAAKSTVTSVRLPRTVIRVSEGLCKECPGVSVWIPPCAIETSLTTIWEDLDRAGVHKKHAQVAELCSVLVPQCKCGVGRFLLVRGELELFHTLFDVRNAHDTRLLRAVGGAALLPAVPRSVPRWPGLSTAALQGPDTGMSLLHWALRHRAEAPLLFDAVAWQLGDLKRTTERGLQPLHVAVAFDVDTHTVKRLLGTASTAEVQGAWSSHDNGSANLPLSPLHLAFLHRRPGLIGALLDGGFDPTEKTRILERRKKSSKKPRTIGDVQIDAHDQALVELGRARGAEQAIVDLTFSDATPVEEQLAALQASPDDQAVRDRQARAVAAVSRPGSPARLKARDPSEVMTTPSPAVGLLIHQPHQPEPQAPDAAAVGEHAALPLVLLDACIACIALEVMAAARVSLHDPAATPLLHHRVCRRLDDIERFGQRRFDRTEARFRQRQLAARLGHVLAGCTVVDHGGVEADCAVGYDSDIGTTDSDVADGRLATSRPVSAQQTAPSLGRLSVPSFFGSPAFPSLAFGREHTSDSFSVYDGPTPFTSRGAATFDARPIGAASITSSGHGARQTQTTGRVRVRRGQARMPRHSSLRRYTTAGSPVMPQRTASTDPTDAAPTQVTTSVCACRCVQWRQRVPALDTARSMGDDDRRRIEEEYRVADLTAVDLASAGLLLALCDPTFADAAAQRRDDVLSTEASFGAFVAFAAGGTGNRSGAATPAPPLGALPGPPVWPTQPPSFSFGEPQLQASHASSIDARRRALFGRVADLCDKASRMADLPRASEAASDVATYRGLVDKMEAGPYRKAHCVSYSAVPSSASWFFHPPILEPVVTDIEVGISTCVNPYSNGGPDRSLDMLPWNCSVPFTEVGLLQSAPMGAASSGAFVYEYDFITRQGLAGLDRTPAPWSHMRFASTVQYGGKRRATVGSDSPSNDSSVFALCTPQSNATEGGCVEPSSSGDTFWVVSELRRPGSWPTEYHLEFNPKPNRSTALFFGENTRTFTHVVIPQDFGGRLALPVWLGLLCFAVVRAAATVFELITTLRNAPSDLKPRRRLTAPHFLVAFGRRVRSLCSRSSPDPEKADREPANETPQPRHETGATEPFATPTAGCYGMGMHGGPDLMSREDTFFSSAGGDAPPAAVVGGGRRRGGPGSPSFVLPVSAQRSSTAQFNSADADHGMAGRAVPPPLQPLALLPDLDPHRSDRPSEAATLPFVESSFMNTSVDTMRPSAGSLPTAPPSTTVEQSRARPFHFPNTTAPHPPSLVSNTSSARPTLSLAPIATTSTVGPMSGSNGSFGAISAGLNASNSNGKSAVAAGDSNDTAPPLASTGPMDSLVSIVEAPAQPAPRSNAVPSNTLGEVPSGSSFKDATPPDAVVEHQAGSERAALPERGYPRLVPVSPTDFAWRLATVAVQAAAVLFAAYCLVSFTAMVLERRGTTAPPPWSVAKDWQKLELTLRIASLFSSVRSVSYLAVLPMPRHFAYVNSAALAAALLALLIAIATQPVPRLVTSLLSPSSVFSVRTLDMITLPGTMVAAVWFRRKATISDAVRQQHYEYLEHVLEERAMHTAERRALRRERSAAEHEAQQQLQQAEHQPHSPPLPRTDTSPTTATAIVLPSDPKQASTRRPPHLSPITKLLRAARRVAWALHRRLSSVPVDERQPPWYVSAITLRSVERARWTATVATSAVVQAALYVVTAAVVLRPLLVSAPGGVSAYGQGGGDTYNVGGVTRFLFGF